VLRFKLRGELTMSLLSAKHAFPIAMTILQIGGAIVYIAHKDYSRAWYFFSGASITTSILFIR
jgi:hypothetical protein